MSYSSYNVRGILCKSDTIAYTSNHKFLPFESQVYLKRNTCAKQHDHSESKHDHSESQHDHSESQHDQVSKICPKC
jgi:hypothetical protein